MCRFEGLATDSTNDSQSEQPTNSLATSSDSTSLQRRSFLSERSLPHVQSGARPDQLDRGTVTNESPGTSTASAGEPSSLQDRPAHSGQSTEAATLPTHAHSAEAAPIISKAPDFATVIEESKLQDPDTKCTPALGEQLVSNERRTAISDSDQSVSSGQELRRRSRSPSPSSDRQDDSVKVKKNKKYKGSKKPSGKEKKSESKKKLKPTKKAKRHTTDEDDGVEVTGVSLGPEASVRKSSKSVRTAIVSSSSKKRSHKRSNSTTALKSTADRIVVGRSDSHKLARDRDCQGNDESDTSVSDAPARRKDIGDDNESAMPRTLKRRKSWSTPSVPDKIDRSDGSSLKSKVAATTFSPELSYIHGCVHRRVRAFDSTRL